MQLCSCIQKETGGYTHELCIMRKKEMIETFKINIPQSEFDDLNERIKKVRWPDEIKNSDWKYGTSLL